MYYSFTFDNGPTFEIHPDGNGYWAIFGNAQHIITTSEAYKCIQMVTQMNAIPEDMSEELKEYGEFLPLLGKWETIEK